MPAAPHIEYFLGYRSRTRTLNPNPITDPNPNPDPKINKKQNDTGMKLNIELYLKVDFLGMGRVYKRPIMGTGKETWIFPSFSRSTGVVPNDTCL